MNDNLEKALAGLLVAGVSALTVVAYKHPNGYARLCRWIIALGAVITTSLLTWTICLVVTDRALRTSGLFPGKTDEIHQVLVRLGPQEWWGIGLSVASAYLVFLLSLPYWLEKEPPKRVHRDE